MILYALLYCALVVTAFLTLCLAVGLYDHWERQQRAVRVAQYRHRLGQARYQLQEIDAFAEQVPLFSPSVNNVHKGTIS